MKNAYIAYTNNILKLMFNGSLRFDILKKIINLFII